MVSENRKAWAFGSIIVIIEKSCCDDGVLTSIPRDSAYWEAELRRRSLSILSRTFVILLA